MHYAFAIVYHMGFSDERTLAGLNMISGAAAYGGELVLTLEGYFLDEEVIGWVKRVLEGFAVDEERLALDLISSQGPGGQFTQEDHTLRFFRREMWIPTLSDRAATVAWMQDGRLSTRERARQLIREKLQDYEPLAQPKDMADRLQATIDRGMADSQAMS